MIGYGEVPEGPSLSFYPLHESWGREGFLQRLVDYGEPGLFEAVSHVWSSLAEPRTLRCTQMGQAAGTGGVGKMALWRFLKAFIEEWLYPPAPIDSPRNYSSLVEWHAVTMAVWKTEAERETEVVRKFAAILNGEAPYQDRDIGTDRRAADDLPGEVTILDSGRWGVPGDRSPADLADRL